MATSRFVSIIAAAAMIGGVPMATAAAQSTSEVNAQDCERDDDEICGANVLLGGVVVVAVIAAILIVLLDDDQADTTAPKPVSP